MLRIAAPQLVVRAEHEHVPAMLDTIGETRRGVKHLERRDRRGAQSNRITERVSRAFQRRPVSILRRSGADDARLELRRHDAEEDRRLDALRRFRYLAREDPEVEIECAQELLVAVNVEVVPRIEADSRLVETLCVIQMAVAAE